MTVTVRQLIEERAAGLVGREDERAVLHGLLEADGPVIVFVHGLAGVGKSTLVQAFANEARDRGATVLHLDCRAIEPTERGFLSALGDATGAASPSPAEAASRLDSLGERVVLVLDTYEVFRLFDAWLQQAFVPSLSDRREGRPLRARAADDRLGEHVRPAVPRPPARDGCRAPTPRRSCASRASTPPTPNGSTASRGATRSRCDSRRPPCHNRPDVEHRGRHRPGDRRGAHGAVPRTGSIR